MTIEAFSDRGGFAYYLGGGNREYDSQARSALSAGFLDGGKGIDTIAPG
jgi:hypothetical protein